MEQDKVVDLRIPGAFQEDALTTVLRDGARRLLAQAVEAEVAAFLAQHASQVTGEGHQRVVRNGYLPERVIQTGIGAVPVRQPRVRDRGATPGEAPLRFTSALLPRYLRRTRSLEDLLPWLYLKGVSTGDFTEVLAALLGPHAPGLSAATISRLKEGWQADLDRWQARDLSTRRKSACQPS